MQMKMFVLNLHDVGGGGGIYKSGLLNQMLNASLFNH